MSLMVRSLLIALCLLPLPALGDSFSEMDRDFAADGFFNQSPSKNGVFNDDAWFSDNPAQADLEKDFFKNVPASGKQSEVRKTKSISHSSAPAQKPQAKSDKNKDVYVTLGGCMFFPGDNGRLRCNLKITNNGKDRDFELLTGSSAMMDNTGGVHESGFESNLKGTAIKSGANYYTYIQKKGVSAKASELKRMVVAIKVEGQQIVQEFKSVTLIKK